MALQIRRGTNANRANITPLSGELVFTTDTQQLYVGDGVTPGGILITGAGGNTTPGGANTQVQFNANGAFGASANLTWDGNTLAARNVYTVGTIRSQGGISAVDNANRALATLNTDAAAGVESGFMQLRSVDTGNANISSTVVIGVPETPAFAASGGYSLILPANAGSNGQVLTTDGNGNLSFTTPASGGGLPIANGSSNINIAAANGPVTVTYGGTSTWTFGNSLTPNAIYWPDGTFQATAFVGVIDVADVTGIGNIATTNYNGDANTRLGGDGNWYPDVVGQPAGTNTQVQFNANGAFGASANLTFDNATGTLSTVDVDATIAHIDTIEANTAITTANLTANGTVQLGTVANVRIAGGTAGQVLTTDGTGNLSFTTVSGGGGGSLIFTQNAWQPGNGPANQTSYWDGNATQVNFKPVAVGYVAAGNVDTLNLLTINGVSISNANITVTPTGFTIPADNIPANVQTATGSLQMIMRVSVGGVNPELGSITLTPSLLSPVPFTTTGILTATGVNPTAVPFWQSTGNGSVTASGLSVSGGTLANVTYDLVQNANVIATSPVQGSFATYTFTNVPVGTGYSLTANINGSGVRGANPNVNTTTASGTTNVTSQFYTPLFYQTTSNSTVPAFTTSTTYVPQQFVSGQTVVMPGTTNGNYYWLATPGATAHTFSTVVLGQTLTVNPDVTGTTTIDTQAYNVYGFTNSQANTVLTIN